jgi:hypothetical protein
MMQNEDVVDITVSVYLDSIGGLVENAKQIWWSTFRTEVNEYCSGKVLFRHDCEWFRSVQIV